MKEELITNNYPKSSVSESFRTLRTNLQFMNFDSNLNTILITSTIPGEGKSWVTSNLAAVFAQTGKKVLVIDADMRNGRQHVIFNTDSRQGLSNFLSNINVETSSKKNSIKNYIISTSISNVDLIPMGIIPPNPSELLASKRLKEALESLKKDYDLVIFDGTPSLLVSDSLILSRIVDMTIIVAQYGKTKKDSLAKIKKEITNVGGKVGGVILNRTPRAAKKYESSYYYEGKNDENKNVTIPNINTNYNEEKIQEIIREILTEEKENLVKKK